MPHMLIQVKAALITALIWLRAFGARVGQRAPQVAQSMVEYAIIAAIVAIVAVTAVKALGEKVSTAFNTVGTQVDDAQKP